MSETKTFEVTTAFSKATMTQADVLSKFRLSPKAAQKVVKLALDKHITVGKTVIMRKT